jgi:hypothetical protein
MIAEFPSNTYPEKDIALAFARDILIQDISGSIKKLKVCFTFIAVLIVSSDKSPTENER